MPEPPAAALGLGEARRGETAGERRPPRLSTLRGGRRAGLRPRAPGSWKALASQSGSVLQPEGRREPGVRLLFVADRAGRRRRPAVCSRCWEEVGSARVASVRCASALRAGHPDGRRETSSLGVSPRPCAARRAARAVSAGCSLTSDSATSPPGSSVHGILQARILGRVAFSSSRASSRPGDGT